MKKHIKKALSFGIVLSIVLGTLVTPSASTDVQVKVTSNPKIDIMLSSKDTTLDLTNFETDVKTSLEKIGIETNNVKFQTASTSYISTDTTSASDIFSDWSCVYVDNQARLVDPAATWSYGTGNTHTEKTNFSDGVYGSSTSTNYSPWVGKTASKSVYSIIQNRVQMTTAKQRPAVCLVNDNGYSTTNGTIEFKYGIDATNYETFGDGEAGFVFRVQDANNYYVYCMDNHGACGNAGWDCYAVVAKCINNEWYFVGKAKMPSYSAGMEWNIKIVMEGDHIQIYKDGEKQFDFYDSTEIAKTRGTAYANTPKFTKGSYGFYVWHQKGAYFSNISLETEEYREFKEILTQPTWREDAKHVVVNVDNNVDNTLTSSATIGEVLSRTLADDIHFIQWGTDTNKATSLNFIKQNDNKGTFTYNNDYNQAVKDTANYIKGLIEQEASEQFVTIGQDINLTVTPENFKTDAISTDYPNGRWKINHDYKHFANNLGQSADAGVYTPNLNCNFDKPGKYEITFDDELVKTIYVHRKPVADFEISFNDTKLILNSVSYDLDTTKNNGYGVGVASETWYYKEASAATWTEGKLTELDKTKIYVIKLEVTDNEGSTSYTTKYVGTGNPVAKFNFANDTVCKFNKLEINNSSYDPIGYDITTQSWELKKDGKVIGTYSAPILDFNTSDLGPGNYTYTLTVTNTQGTKSEAYTKSFTIVDDVAKPEIIIEAEVSNEWVPDADIQVELNDNESNIAKWRYEFTTSPTPTTTDDDWSAWDTEETKVNVNSGALSGRYYLHIQAYDEANNLTERTVGPFNLDNTNPVINGVDVNKLGFRETKVTVNAFDEHSGIVGYALTKYETATFSLRARTFAATPMSEFQESNEFMVDEDGLYTAWAIDALGNVETAICEVTQSNQTDKTTNVYAEIGSEFKVTIPKRIVLDGVTKSGTYQVTVEGDIAGLETITVEPENAVTLSSKNKSDVVGSIAQDKINWTYSEIYTDSKILANGAISAQDITAGAWNGTFNFNIKLENNGKYTNSIWDVEYQEFIFGEESNDSTQTIEPTE